VLVVGGGPAGVEAALRVAEGNGRVVLVEKGAVLGGTPLRLSQSFPRWEDPKEMLGERLARLRSFQAAGRVRILPRSIVASVRRLDEGFSVTVRSTDASGGAVAEGETQSVEVGAVVLSTGFEPLDVTRYGEYGYGIYPGVITSLEFEERLRDWRSGAEDRCPTQSGPSGGRSLSPRSVAFVKCVGSRDKSKGYPYCSKICCMYTAKQAGAAMDLFPEGDCYVFYMDYRAAGNGYEEFVREVIEKQRVRYVRGRPSKVLPSHGRLLVRAEDTLTGVPVEVDVDLVVLAAASRPSLGSAELGEMFGVGTDEYGFFKTCPSELTCCADRVFAAGAAVYPASIEESQLQGAAAAAQVLALLSHRGVGEEPSERRGLA
jgi:heterodisulfide reductase subunit A